MPEVDEEVRPFDGLLVSEIAVALNCAARDTQVRESPSFIRFLQISKLDFWPGWDPFLRELSNTFVDWRVADDFRSRKRGQE